MPVFLQVMVVELLVQVGEKLALLGILEEVVMVLRVFDALIWKKVFQLLFR